MIKANDEKKRIEDAFHGTGDLGFREFKIGKRAAILCFVDGLVDKSSVELNLLKPLLDAKEPPEGSCAEFLKTSSAATDEPTAENDFDKAIDSLAQGDTLILIDGAPEYYLFAMRGQPSRSISEPPTSTVLKGPREGFTEDLRTNTVLLRKRLRSRDFVSESMKIGKYTRTGVSVVYLDGVADPKVVSLIKERLSKINIDGVIDSSYLTEFLKERKAGLLKQVGLSEKPDIVAAKLLEGRVAIIADGSPVVITLPFVLTEDLQDSADYFKSDTRAFFIRIIRLAGIVISLLIPGFYVAVLTQHYQLLPLNFLLSLLGTVHELPFTPEIEMIFVLVIFEILNEASIRMPRYVGMSLSLIGAIILGDTAVKAGLISSPTVLIAAVSNIGMYCVPDEVSSFSLFRLGFVLAAALFGFFGLVVAGIAALVYLLTYDGYGAPYLAPFAPYIAEDTKDAIDKGNLLDRTQRPGSIPRADNDVRLR